MLNPLSLITTPIELYMDNELISSGTGFYYKSVWDNKEGIFLITNYHVLTGNDPKKRELKPIGNFITFYYHIDPVNPSGVVGIKIPLFTKNKKKTWIEHPNPSVDISLIPIVFSLPMTPEWSFVDKNLAETEIEVSPSDPVTLIGYPRMYFDKRNALPIYKTGNVASEYDYDFDGNPYFLIDISAYSGNSGSPVFSLQKNAQIVSEQTIIKVPGSTIKFLGVYSAGITDPGHFLPIREIRRKVEGIITDLDMQLGVVWRANLIEEIIKHNSYQLYEDIGKELVKEKGFKYKVSKGIGAF